MSGATLTKQQREDLITTDVLPKLTQYEIIRSQAHIQNNTNAMRAFEAIDDYIMTGDYKKCSLYVPTLSKVVVINLNDSPSVRLKNILSACTIS